MQQDTINTLDAFFQKTPIMKAGPVPRPEIDTALGNFQFSLPEDYLTFIEKYGGAIVGPYRIYGLRKAPSMGSKEASVLDITDRFVKQHWLGVENWLVISTDLSGNPIGLASDGKVWISDHDHGQVTVVATSFEEFLRSWCLKP